MVVATENIKYRRIIQCVSLGIIAGFYNNFWVDVVCAISISRNSNGFKQRIGNLLLTFIGLGIDLILMKYF